MKSLRRKLLSLLLAMAMVLSLVPTALAAGESVTINGATTGTVGTAIEFTATLNGFSSQENLSYSWSASGVTESPVTGQGTTLSVTPTKEGTLTVNLTVTIPGTDDAEGTPVPATAKIVTVSNPQVTTPAEAASVVLSATSASLTVGGSTSVTATVKDADNNPLSGRTVTVQLASGSSAVTGLSVTGGTTNGQGVATISISSAATGVTGSTAYTVTCGGVTAANNLSITVNAAPASVTAAITPTNGTVNVNGTLTMTVTPTPSTAEYDFVEWNVTNGTGSATINKSSIKNQAVLFGTAAGTVSVSAVLKKGNATSSTTVATASAVTVTVGSGNRATLRGTPANTSAIYLDNWTNSTGTGYEGFTVTPYVDNVLVTPTNPTYTWSVNGTPVSNYYYNSFNLTSYNASLHYGNTANTVSCKATFTWNNQTFTTDEYTWTVYTGYNNYLASVNVTNSYTYALGNRDDNNGSSIVDQLSSRYYNAGYYTPSSVQFLSTTHTYGTLNANTTTTYSLSSANANYLGNVVFTPSNSAGKAVFSVRVYFSNSATPLDGTICFDTSGSTVTSGDINYSGGIGDTVYFDSSDFSDFYYSKTSGGTLNYVTFSTVSTGSGTLYSDGVRLSSGTPCYASATYRQNSLDGVSFAPSGNTASKGGTVRIAFTASGTRGNYGYNGTISGTVVINYLNGAAKDITYTPTGSSINLSAGDFTAAYREVMGSTAPNDLTIQFQSVPDNGTLTYKSSSTATPVTLRATNVKSYRFSTNGSGSNQIANVTYTVSGTRSDTVEYIAYTGGVARFTGKVVFNPSSVSTSVIVTLTCPSSTGGAFNLAEFTKANAVVMANTFQVRFLMPTRGTLTYNGMTATAAGLTVPVNMINSVYYRPNAGLNGIDTVAFVCLDAAGNQVGTGQVNIVVSGTGTSTNNGVTSISQFTDISSNAWYATALADLVSRGIVQGTGNGKAEPRGTLNYGQALKMILLAAGYPAQAELSGNQWAANYKSLAVSNGLIDSSVNLTAPISRDAVVELIAKALKVSPVTGNSPFKDSNNGYAIALNRTNPAIIIGNEDGTFNGSSTLLRQEVWAIVYRMNQYANMQYSTQMPDGI